MRLRGGEFLFRCRLEQILETRHAIFEDEIEFSLFLVHQIVEEANHVLMVHFPEEFDLQTHVVLAVGNLSQFPFLYNFYGFSAQSHAVFWRRGKNLERDGCEERMKGPQRR